MRFVFDLDNTLVTHPRVSGDYSSCEPKERNVRLVQELSAAGHYIIIWTARRMRTKDANVGAVIKDVGLVTLQSLQKFEIPFDELHFGKPHADLYINDLAVNALVDTEKELGWSCAAPKDKEQRGMVPARSFNSVVVVDNTVIKSAKRELIRGEVFFYRSIPDALRRFFPKVVSIEDGESRLVTSFTMERLRGVTLSHLLTSRVITSGRLARVLAALEEIHTFKRTQDEAASFGTVQANIYANYSDKVSGRFAASPHAYAAFPEAQYLCTLLCDHLLSYEKQMRGARADIIHGDPVFSNILLTASNDVFFIDMRGRVGDVLTTCGDVVYDLAKLYQSLCGYDDILLTGLPPSKIQEDYLRKLRSEFRAHIKGSAFYSAVLPMPAGLRDLEISACASAPSC